MLNYVILCGGSGSRLWPLSREKMPKQLLPLVNERTMLQNTVLRIKDLPVNIITVICNIDHAFLVKKQIEELDLDIQFQIITEPIGRDSCAAVCIASLLGNLDDTTLIVPCDHVFDVSEFTNVVLNGITYAESSIITFGISPTRPETGYGYIEIDKTNNKTLNFVEKPNYETACEYIESKKFYWNAGVFLFKNKNVIHCFKDYAPDILLSCEFALNDAKNSYDEKILNLPKNFLDCRSISFDYGIMEKLCADENSSVDKITLVYSSTWCDIGSFHVLHEHLLEENAECKNVLKGDIILHKTSNCYIETENKLVAAVGLDNLVIVNTRDALLVCNKDMTQHVKDIVGDLKNKNREERIIHSKAYRPWGWYQNIEGNDTNGFKVKRICVFSGKKLSLLSHDKRSEHWVIIKGSAKVQVGHDFLNLGVNQHVYIPKKTLHRMENVGPHDLEFIETQIGAYLGEDDIIRYEDDFGRV